jgi:hypothetical protein
MSARAMSRSAAFAAALFIAASSLVILPARARASDTQITYSVSEVRAYGFKVSLSKQVLELVPPCDPSQDPYKCDNSQYEHKPNCPSTVALGRTKPGPVAEPPDQTIVSSGGAGDSVGDPPEQSSPVRLNRLLSIGRLSRSGEFTGAGGFASDQYVDLNGRQTPEAHAQSEAASNLPDYEERCYPVGVFNQNSYEHFLSRSFDQPHTYDLSECFGSQCTLGAGISVERAISIVDVREEKGIVIATARSTLLGLELVPGTLRVDAMSSYLSARSDGTRDGLKWSVATTLSGVTLAGQKITLPLTQSIPVGDTTVALAQPYVKPADNGHLLRIMSPGLGIENANQAIFLGGVELSATFDRAPVGTLSLPPIPALPPITPPAFVPGTDTRETTPGAVAPPVQQVPAQYAIQIYDTGGGTLAAIFVAGIVGLFVLFGRWSQRWAWGRALHRMQPFKGIDWIYRAFVKT